MQPTCLPLLSVAATLRLLSQRYPFSPLPPLRCPHHHPLHRRFSASPTPLPSSPSRSPLSPTSSSPLSPHPHPLAHHVSPLTTRVSPHEQSSSLLSPPLSRLRSFAVLAHIDHGKSTLADRLLELSGNIQPLDRLTAQVLDHLQVERERGITVKAQTATLFHRHTDAHVYILNLIDTPGHVDFSYEVSRSLAACQGVLLLVDSSQGIQAQTLANHHAAVQAGLDIVPVLTKVDLPHARPDAVAEEMEVAFGVEAGDILRLSSKTGVGVEAVMPAIIERVRPPGGQVGGELRALVFDSWYDLHRGCVLLVQVRDGEVSVGDKVASYHSGHQWEVQEVGLLMPHQRPTDSLHTGQVGYLIAGIRSTRDARLGETLYKLASKKHRGPVGQLAWQTAKAGVEPLPGFRPAQAKVYAGIFPSGGYAYDDLCVAVEKLSLNDASVQVEKESSAALGMGLRIGFLGLLHLDVFCSRLEQEFGASVLKTAPTVPYTAVMDDGAEVAIDSPAKFPTATTPVAYFLEPFITATLITPHTYQGPLMTLCQSSRGTLLDLSHLSDTRLSLRYRLPLAEVVHDFYDKVKSLSSGYASFDYEEAEAEEADLVKLDVKLNGESVDALSCICVRGEAEGLGRRMAVKLKEAIDKQQFEVVIQACVGAKVICRERVAPYRKDVLLRNGKVMGGGDVTRKKKLLEKQKEGKKRMKMVGSVELNEQVFASVMKL